MSKTYRDDIFMFQGYNVPVSGIICPCFRDDSSMIQG
jgi:hypothetical protein